LGLLALVVFVGLSLASFDPADPPSTRVFPARTDVANLGGTYGAHAAHWLRAGFGFGAYFIVFSLFVADVRLFSRTESTDRVVRILGRVCAIAALCIGLQIVLPTFDNAPVIGNGGYIGAAGADVLTSWTSLGGTVILVVAGLLSGILVTGEYRLLVYAFRFVTAPVRMLNRLAFGRLRGGWKAWRDPDLIPLADEADDLSGTSSGAELAGVSLDLNSSRSRKPIKVNPPASTTSARDEVMKQIEAGSLRMLDEEYELPDVEMLEQAEDFPYELLAKKAQVAAEILERTFQEFGLNVRVVEIDTGPVVTQFELQLDAGLRLSKVTSLADDLAVALRVPSVRVVHSIPGKNTVGVEVPNEKQVMVRLRELVESCRADAEKKQIPIFLGKDVSGRPLTVDLAKMPHLLIAGRTGTGKSVCLNTLILSMLMTRSPDQVKMLMIDPKMVELSPYKRIPHLMHPVITDMKKAEAVLAWAVEKMEERYNLLARCGVRHLDNFNRLGKQKVLERIGVDADSEEADAIPESMPYIVIVADEMADMMMTSGKDVEGHIIRLAQKSRAVGIHLVLATQKPTVDVITGLIKSNLPARISFQVASRTDSRVVLDETGADRLLGNGDMLYLAPGTSKVTRAQGTFVSDDEVNDVIEFFSDIEPQYSDELAQLSTAGSGGKSGGEKQRNHDDLYEQAIEVVIREGRGSVSLLQRALGVGYGRGARLIDYMAEDGIVGEYNGSQAREVLYTPEQWEAAHAGDALEEAAI